MDSIRVAIRVRPLLKRESGSKLNWLVEDNTIFQVNDAGKRVSNAAFTFDRIFDKDMDTVDLYMDFAKPIVLSVMEGINGTLFAYGQTSSGKTYTMTGDETSPGIIPHSLGEIFDYISGTENREFLLRVSYMEIYNEVITDLLKPKHTNLKIHENAQKEVFVGDLTEKVVTSVEEIIDLMKIGESNRHFGCTNMNERSSRSHTIFRMVIESRETAGRNSIGGGEVDGAVKVSILNLVDLAGSERASATGAEGIRLREGGFINKSLFALGNVINKLSDGDSSTFVPFRDSKLTRILQTSLGGNAKTSIICAVTPASNDETLSTLQFASRAKRIKNRPEVNEVLDESTLLKRYRKEINELKKQLEQINSQEPMVELQMEKDKMEQLLHEQRKLADEQRRKMRELTNFFCTAPPKETEKQTKRNKRRWTVCPMGALSKPPIHLDLPTSFNAGFRKPNNKRERKTEGSSSSDDGSSPKSIDSNDFNRENLKQFFSEIDEKEEEIDEIHVEKKLCRRSGPIVSNKIVVEEKRSSLAENAAAERIAELEQELERVKEERDAFEVDLSDNITSSCEMQADLFNAKKELKERQMKIRELQELVVQFDTSRDNTVHDRTADEKQISELKQSLATEKEMVAITEATLHDICISKEEIEQQLVQYKEKNNNLTTALNTATTAKDETALECQRLRERTEELEDKLELLSVIQGELLDVDRLQEELREVQEKNSGLEEDVRRGKEDYLTLQEELEQHLGVSAGYEKILAEQEIDLETANKQFDEAVKKIVLLEEENTVLRSQISDTEVIQPDQDAAIDELRKRAEELQDENASLCRQNEEINEKCCSLEKELRENCALVVDLKATIECDREKFQREQATKIEELNEELGTVQANLDGKMFEVDELTVKLTEAKVSLTEYESRTSDVNENEEMSAVLERDAVVQELKEQLLEATVEKQKYESMVAILQEECAKGINEAEESRLMLEGKSQETRLMLEAKSQETQLMLEAKSQETQLMLEAKSQEAESIRSQLRDALTRNEALVCEYETKMASLEEEVCFKMEDKESLLIEQDDTIAQLEEKLQQANDISQQTHNEAREIMRNIETQTDVKNLEKLSQEALAEDVVIDKNDKAILSHRLEELEVELERKEGQIEELRQQVESANRVSESSVTNESEVDMDNVAVEWQHNIDSSHILMQKLVEKETELEKKCVAVEELKERLMVLEEKLQHGSHEELREKLLVRETELEEKCLSIGQLKERLAMFEEEQGMIQPGDLVEELQGKLLTKEAELEEKCASIGQLKERLVLLEEKQTGLQYEGLVEELQRKLLVGEAELEEKCASIEQLKERLVLLEEKQVELHHGDLVEELQGKLLTKEAELDEKCASIGQLKEKLVLLEEKQAELQYEGLVEELQRKLLVGEAKLEVKCVSIEQLKERLVLLEEKQAELHHGDLVGELQGKLLVREAELEEKCASIEQLKERLVLLEEKQAELQHGDLVEELQGKLLTKEAELEEKCTSIEQLQGRLVLLEEKQAERQLGDLVEELQGKLLTKEAELEEKCISIEELKERLVLLEGKQAEIHQGDLIEELQEKLLEKEAELDAKCTSIEEMKEILVLLEGKQTEHSELVEQLNKKLAQKDAELKEKCANFENLIVENEAKHKELQKSREDMARRNNEMLEEINEMKDRLGQAVSAKDSLAQESEDLMAKLQKEFEEQVEIKNAEISEKTSGLSERTELMELAKENAAKIQHELNGKIIELEQRSAEIAELRAEMDSALSSKEEILEGNKEAMTAVQKDLEEQLKNQGCELQSKVDMIEKLRSDLEEERNLIASKEAEEQNNISHIKTLDEELQRRDDELKELHEAVEKHESYMDGLKNEFSTELQRMESCLQEKADLCSKLEQELSEELSKCEVLVQDHQVYVDELKKEFSDELERTNAIMEEKSTIVKELEEKMTAELTKKTSEISAMECKLEKEAEVRESIVAESASLLTKCQNFEEELKKVRYDLETKADELVALETEKRELVVAKDVEIDDLCQKIENLKSECTALQEQLGILEETKAEMATKDERIAELTTKVDELSKDSEAKASRTERRRRESLLFKSMLEDIKENCLGEEEENQSKLIDELNHTLMATQEKLEQNEFVIDEKEIEIAERDSLIEGLEAKLRESSDLRFTQETKLGELTEKLQRRSGTSEEKDGVIEEFKEKLALAEERLEKMEEDSREVIERFRREKDELQSKVDEYESILSEEQLKELYNTMELKEKRISEMEEELAGLAKKEQKIAELEMELEVVQNDVLSWKTRSDEAQESLSDLKEIIKEQERHIVGLEASKKELESQKAEDKSTELRELREELAKNRGRLEEFEAEKNRGLQKVCELGMELEVVQNEALTWKSRSEEAQASLGDLKETVKEQEEHILNLEEAKKELANQKAAENSSELRGLQEKLATNRKRLEEYEAEKNRGLQKICEMEMELEVVQNEALSWKTRSENAQASLSDLKETIKEQEEQILGLEALKKELANQKVADNSSELQELRDEVARNRKRLEEFEKEKNRGLELMEAKNEMLNDCENALQELEESLEEKEEELRKTTERLEQLMKGTNTVEEHKTKEEIRKTRIELEKMEEAYRKVSQKLELAMKELSAKRHLAKECEELRSEISMKDYNYKKEQEERADIEKIVSEREAECSELRKQIKALEAVQSGLNTASHMSEQAQVEQQEREKEMAKLKGQLDHFMTYSKQCDLEYREIKDLVQEMDDEIEQYKTQVEDLQSEKEQLQSSLEAAKQSQESSEEILSLKSQISALETELTKHRTNRSLLEVEEELKRVKSELKGRDLEHYHQMYERQKELENAKGKVREFEKDCARYEKKNNDLRTEIRRLRSQEDEPTLDIGKNQNCSRTGENVGVIGSVALFTLDAKVAKLEEANAELAKKSETLTKKNGQLNIVNIDLKQKYNEITAKYNRLKEKYTKTVDSVAAGDIRTRETTYTNPSQPKEQAPVAEQVRASKPRESDSIFSKPLKTAAQYAKESSGVEKPKRTSSLTKQNKENFLTQDKPDACKAQ